MPHSPRTDEVRAVDMEIGGDDDMPGIGLELTTDDIDDIALDGGVPLKERRQRLMELRDELDTRLAGDMTGDMAALSEHVKDRIASLGNAQERAGFPGSTGMDAADRSDDDDPADAPLISPGEPEDEDF